MASLVANTLSLLVKPTRIVRRNKYNIALPNFCHIDISSSVICDRAVFVIGDVHGCLDEMCELMDKACSIEKNSLFILVGDLVNKGPYSVGVVRKLKEMGSSVYAVRGNHDEGALREIESFTKDREYHIPERYNWIKDLNVEDVDFLSSLPYTISIPCLNTLIVHGGLVPGTPLEVQRLNDLTNMRNVIDTGDPFDSDGLIGYNKLDKGVAWIDMWPGPEHVYFGHDALRKLQRGSSATGLDTGCCYGGRLTGVFVNGCRQFLSVNSRQRNTFDDD